MIRVVSFFPSSTQRRLHMPFPPPRMPVQSFSMSQIFVLRDRGKSSGNVQTRTEHIFTRHFAPVNLDRERH